MAKDPVRRRFWLLVAGTAVLASIAILIRTLGHDARGGVPGIWFESAALLFVVLVPTTLTLACEGKANQRLYRILITVSCCLFLASTSLFRQSGIAWLSVPDVIDSVLMFAGMWAYLAGWRLSDSMKKRVEYREAR